MPPQLPHDKRSIPVYIGIESFRQSNVEINSSTSTPIGDNAERMYIEITNPADHGGVPNTNSIFFGAANVENDRTNNLGGKEIKPGVSVQIGVFENVKLEVIAQSGAPNFKIDIVEIK